MNKQELRNALWMSTGNSISGGDYFRSFFRTYLSIVSDLQEDHYVS